MAAWTRIELADSPQTTERITTIATKPNFYLVNIVQFFSYRVGDYPYCQKIKDPSCHTRTRITLPSSTDNLLIYNTHYIKIKPSYTSGTRTALVLPPAPDVI